MTADADNPDKWPRPIWFVEDDGKVFRIVYFPYREQVPPAKVPDPGKVVMGFCKACPHYEEGQKQFLSQSIIKKLFGEIPTEDKTVVANTPELRNNFMNALGAVMEYAEEVKRMSGEESHWEKHDPIDPAHPIRVANETETRLYGHGYVKVGI